MEPIFFLAYKSDSYKPKTHGYTRKKFPETIRGLLSGYFLVALYQGIIAFILMKIFGIKAALLFSVLLMFSSYSTFGAGLICFLRIILLFTDSVIKGILFLVLSAFFISFLDNFLRPFFLQDRIKVHPLLIFFAILGGLKIFGLNGLILGPTVIILFFAVLDMLVSFDEENFVEENHNPREKNTIEPIE